MLPAQWDTFKRAARREKLDKIPMALIIDSPWIPGLSRHQAHGLLPRSRAVVPVEPEDHAGVPGHHLRPLAGGWNTAWRPSRRCSARRSSSGRTTRRASTTRSTGSRTSTSSRSTKSRPTRFAAMTLHRYEMHKQRILDHGYILPMVTVARPALHGRLRPQHDALHDRPGREPEGRAQADRPLHARDHRLAQGAAQGDGRHGRGHLHPRRHRRLHQRRALQGVRPPVPEAHLRRVPEGLGEALSQRRRGRRLPRPPARRRLQRAQLGQAEGHPRGEAARRRSHVPDGQRQPAGDRACAARRTK